MFAKLVHNRPQFGPKAASFW